MIAAVSPQLRRGLVLRFGVEDGSDAHAAAVAYAWEHQHRIVAMSNPAGYLFRVGQTAAKRIRRSGRRHAEPERSTNVTHASDVPELDAALARLRPQQRAATVLVHGYGYSYHEVAELLGTTDAAIRNDVHRGLAALRRQLDLKDS
jgi:RNA polymerase sigma-70 factor (ECF subfamily)